MLIIPAEVSEYLQQNVRIGETFIVPKGIIYWYRITKSTEGVDVHFKIQIKDDWNYEEKGFKSVYKISQYGGRIGPEKVKNKDRNKEQEINLIKK